MFMCEHVRVCFLHAQCCKQTVYTFRQQLQQLDFHRRFRQPNCCASVKYYFSLFSIIDNIVGGSRVVPREKPMTICKLMQDLPT